MASRVQSIPTCCLPGEATYLEFEDLLLSFMKTLTHAAFCDDIVVTNPCERILGSGDGVNGDVHIRLYPHRFVISNGRPFH